MNLVFDFDGTITVKDTIFQLAQAAIAFQSKHSGKQLQAAWDDIVKAYGDDHKSFANQYTPPEDERRSPEEELLYLSSLRDTEHASLDRVDKSGLFSGLTKQDLFQMGRDQVCSGAITIRDGFIEMIELARQNGWQVGVLSVNWSREFIEGVLHPHSVPIITNQIAPDGKIQGPDDFNDGARLTTSRDKANSLNQLISKQGHSSTPTIYFGDSTTDMECLLTHRGIVISADAKSSLMQTLERVGVPVPHVGSPQDGANIFWARDFQEILLNQTLERISKGQ
ncbi:had-like domain [Trichoderma arundinaceum]|uniref:Had-like domain n=1 Tax=Trichoderma arundinaceum TaxID=490622 RepID=A0A395NAD5_TRIAR|nr:had-like domain [Trichoderma arundinaceum]